MIIPYIDSISGVVSIAEADILQLLEHPCDLGGNSEFKGKVSTHLYADTRHVLKLKTPYAFAPAKASAWCKAQLEKERAFAIYLPNRHWLVLQRDDGCAIANVSERHPTLDTVLRQQLAAGDTARFSQLLERLFAFYFRFWQDHQLRQDDGLTNYVLMQDQLYYVDDDIYSTDQLVSLAHGLTGIIRRLPALDEAIAARLGRSLRQVLAALDPVYPATLAEHFDGVFVTESRRATLDQLIGALKGRSPTASPPSAEADAPPRFAGNPESIAGQRVALLADIHANYLALQAVIRDLEREGIDQAIVLGDLIGYGPQPLECLRLLQQQPWIFVRGNHDHALSLGEAGERLSRVAKASLAWTLDRVGIHDRAWLGELPFYWRSADLYAVHGSPADASFMNAYVYAATAEHNLDKLQERGISICFHGHSHIQGTYFRNRIGIDQFAKSATIELRKGHTYLICPGAVGLPRDGTLAAQYAIYDDAARRVQFREVPYNRDDFLDAAKSAALPELVQHMLQRP